MNFITTLVTMHILLPEASGVTTLQGMHIIVNRVACRGLTIPATGDYDDYMI